MMSSKKRKIVNFIDSELSIKKEKLGISETEVVDLSNEVKGKAVVHTLQPNEHVKASGLLKLKASDRRKLPISRVANHFAQELSKCETLILMGETGSGKSTQIPQIIFEYANQTKKDKQKLGFRKIAITEPRRIAAMSLAKRVQDELNASKLPSALKIDATGIVGYKVRFQTSCTPQTKILFMTEGMLLQEAMGNSNLSKYDIIVIDEAHERSINTDLLLGLVNKAQSARTLNKLKLVIMTATGDADKMFKFFPNSKVLLVSGVAFPVDQYYLDEKSNDYLCSTVSCLMNQHASHPPEHHILVFLTGQEEIESVIHQLSCLNTSIPIMACPLYAALSETEQHRAFELPPPGTRKIVVATNIAETSVTIPGIKVVIDCGHVKSRYYLGTCALDAFQVHKISKSQAIQRAGRAGRQQSGEVYRIFTQEEFNKLEEFEMPEIQRSNLSQAVSMINRFGFNNLEEFPFVDKPDGVAVEDAVAELKQLGAIDPFDTSITLTKLGVSLSKYPLEPKISKVVWTASMEGVLPEVCSIVGMMESDNLFTSTTDKEKRKALEGYWAPEGDLLTYLNLYRKFNKSKTPELWCDTNKVNLRAMRYAAKVREQLLQIDKTKSISPKSNLNEIQMKEGILSSFTINLPMNRAVLDREGRFYVINDPRQLSRSIRAKIHPSSVLSMSRPPVIFFTRVTLNDNREVFLHHCSVIDKKMEAIMNEAVKTCTVK